MARVLAIAVVNTRRMFRVPTNLFFAFVLPMLLILILGATFGGSNSARVGVVGAHRGPLEAALLAELRNSPNLELVGYDVRSALVTDVSRGRLAAGLVVPAGYDAAVTGGSNVTVDFIARPDRSSQQLAETLRGAVAKQAALLGAARFAVDEHAAVDFASAVGASTAALGSTPVVSVTQTTTGTATFAATLGQFDESAWTSLLLFLFFTALSGSLALIQTRRLGLSRRMLSTPTSAGTVIVGETLARLFIGLIQATVIIAGTALLFGVDWGQPLGVGAVVLLFVLVASGAGICLGTLANTEQQAIGFSVLASMGLAALGGCMVPLEIFSTTMKHIAHVTPHAWANDAFAQLVANGASVTDITRQLMVLAAFAAGLLALATWRLRHVLLD